MNAIPSASYKLAATEESRRSRWPVLVAWLLIAGVAAFAIVRATRYRGNPNAVMVEEIVNIQIQGRYLVGASTLGIPGMDPKAVYEQAQSYRLNRGSYSQRLRFAVMAGELAGPDEAIKALNQLEEARRSDPDHLHPREVSVKTARMLERLYAGYRQQPGRPNLLPEDQDWLRSRLGWFGELALAPRDGDSTAREHALAPAQRMLVVYFSAIGLGGLGLLAGGMLGMVLVILACLGRLPGGLECGTGRGGVYAETFALYMLLFVGFSYLARLVPVPARLSMALGTAVAFASLLALVWPRLRGISWRQVRDDLGLHLDGQPTLQLLCGPVAYLCTLPLVFAGALITYGLMEAQRRLGLGDSSRPGAGPTHPILGEVLGADVWTWVQVFLAACVAAPIVEEIMFRGVLYRHLREASYRWGRVLSVVFSAAASGFVFAAIHPQGWLGIPVLMSLAFLFALVREWRRSLLPSVIAHGLHNGILLLMLLLATV